MKKLVLLSDLDIEDNLPLVMKIKDMVGVSSAKLGYIPSQLDLDRKYFSASIQHFNRLGFQEFLYFDVDEEYDERLIDELLHCDAIYLSGGNTFYFLQNLRQKNITILLKEAVEQGKLLIGMSAGSIMMSSTIKMAGLIDVNGVGLKDLDALNIVEFDFMPHWEHKRSLERLVDYSNENQKKVYACHDGEGLVVEGDRLETYGDVICIQRGQQDE
ncbi:Type 1 glutamine amidotransferase-like domain-containing protein [Peribacillus acanthi]|uniref:Type 1 glutamine amidotransferase-like domain-containing protein n=1 Tax=Peribacillus acanthi TaxID=2171554 RepID=UPI000D3EDC93|nr:Type 1 glutamine amidotransferase-like domain-containing protein [Peribacillus acanthi]